MFLFCDRKKRVLECHSISFSSRTIFILKGESLVVKDSAWSYTRVQSNSNELMYLNYEKINKNYLNVIKVNYKVEVNLD